MPKLCLGTANFGTRYGLKKNKINENEILKIIKFSNKNKLLNIDTSFEYLHSHKQLNKFISNKFNITSKIFFKKKINIKFLKKKIFNFNNNSPSKINNLLFHNQVDALQKENIEIFKKLKTDGIVKKIGVSVYDISILKKILKLWEPDIIQIPVNPFNLDFTSSKFLKSLKRRNILIFARSIFLQGILVNKSFTIDKRFENNLKDWFKICKLKSIHPVKACLDFCKSIKELDFLIIGVQNAEELKEIIRLFKQPTKLNSNLIIKRKYKKIDLRKI